MFDNPEICKLIIFALIGIIAILVVAVIYLAVKKNVYYEDENGHEVRPPKKGVKNVQPTKPVVQAQPVTPVKPVAPVTPTVTPTPVTLVPMEDEPTPAPVTPIEPVVTPLTSVMDVKGSVVRGAEVNVTMNGETETKKITGFPCLIGRESASCDLVVSEAAVSRRHAQIVEENGNLYLEGVAEHNGTYLNGTKLPPLGRARLHESDKIRLGRAEIDIVKLIY